MLKAEEKISEAQEKKCVLSKDNGEHRTMGLSAHHRKGYKFWVDICPHCGWINTEKIEKTYSYPKNK
jgi:hypothetical protein